MHDLHISFLTQQVPPPFAHGYTISLEKQAQDWQIRFQLEYLQRETLSEEEILEEGFIGDDDFTWAGKLPPTWIKKLDQVLQFTAFSKSQPEAAQNHLFFEFVNNGKSGFPENFLEWEYILEELIQAIYELAKKELPFRLHVVNIKRNVDLRLEARFATRSFFVKGSKRTFPWERLKDVLGQIENLEIDEKPKPKPPKKGFWISFDDDQYFEIKPEVAASDFIDTLMQ